MLHRYFILGLLLFSLAACEKIAVKFSSKKQAKASTSELAKNAEQLFWNTLHEGHYEKISDADRMLTAAYLENPNDPIIASHIGFLHIWKITERQREKTVSPLIVNEIILAKKYFADSNELNPHDARILGFLGDSQLAEGQIFHDEREQTLGYFTVKKAIKHWPEFNYFAGGFVMSTLPQDSPHFKEAVDWQWRTLDLCAEEKVDRKNPDFTPYMAKETKTGRKRACWNSWIAPHNFEGFFMNMGDMVRKSGDEKTAMKLYRNATLAKNYSTWPYRQELEKRMQNPQMKVLMFNSGYGCMACHQN